MNAPNREQWIRAVQQAQAVLMTAPPGSEQHQEAQRVIIAARDVLNPTARNVRAAADRAAPLAQDVPHLKEGIIVPQGKTALHPRQIDPGLAGWERSELAGMVDGSEPPSVVIGGGGRAPAPAKKQFFAPPRREPLGGQGAAPRPQPRPEKQARRAAPLGTRRPMFQSPAHAAGWLANAVRLGYAGYRAMKKRGG